MLAEFYQCILELIIKTSTELPPDVRSAMKAASDIEAPDTRSGQALSIINLNIDQASDGEGAICQDTGMPTFEVRTPRGADQIWMAGEIRKARGGAPER